MTYSRIFLICLFKEEKNWLKKKLIGKKFNKNKILKSFFSFSTLKKSFNFSSFSNFNINFAAYFFYMFTDGSRNEPVKSQPDKEENTLIFFPALRVSQEQFSTYFNKLRTHRYLMNKDWSTILARVGPHSKDGSLGKWEIFFICPPVQEKANRHPSTQYFRWCTAVQYSVVHCDVVH